MSGGRTNTFWHRVAQPGLTYSPPEHYRPIGGIAVGFGYTFQALDTGISTYGLHGIITTFYHASDWPHGFFYWGLSIGVAVTVFVMIQHGIFRSGGAYETIEELLTSKRLHGESPHKFAVLDTVKIIGGVYAIILILSVGYTLITDIAAFIIDEWPGGTSALDHIGSILFSIVISLFIVSVGHFLAIMGWHMRRYANHGAIREQNIKDEMTGLRQVSQQRQQARLDTTSSASAQSMRASTSMQNGHQATMTQGPQGQQSTRQPDATSRSTNTQPSRPARNVQVLSDDMEELHPKRVDPMKP